MINQPEYHQSQERESYFLKRFWLPSDDFRFLVTKFQPFKLFDRLSYFTFSAFLIYILRETRTLICTILEIKCVSAFRGP